MSSGYFFHGMDNVVARITWNIGEDIFKITTIKVPKLWKWMNAYFIAKRAYNGVNLYVDWYKNVWNWSMCASGKLLSQIWRQKSHNFGRTNRIVVKIGREFSLTSKLPKAFNGICMTNGRMEELTDWQSYCNVTFMTGVRKCFDSKILKQTFHFFSQNFPSLSKYYLY